jgi:heme A synthase
MLHPRAFKVSVVWTLALLFLGSVVHATESSLACPDWPTCFGSLVPEMTGGVFWEHLHRLVAGGLVLMFGLATWLAWREASDRPWVFRASLAGMGLLLVQSVFGGLTVLYRLPDLVSTTHLTLAFGFLSLATVLAVATHGAASIDSGRAGGSAPPRTSGIEAEGGRRLRDLAALAAGLVFGQSVLGALVRHTDGGMSCPDVPLCLGQVVPPLVNIQITSHFLHRAVAIVATVAILWLAMWVYRHDVPDRVRRWVLASVFLVIVQVALGVVSILTVLSVVPVSLHTLVAALLLTALVAVATLAAREVDAPTPVVDEAFTARG